MGPSGSHLKRSMCRAESRCRCRRLGPSKIGPPTPDGNDDTRTWPTAARPPRGGGRRPGGGRRRRRGRRGCLVSLLSPPVERRLLGCLSQVRIATSSASAEPGVMAHGLGKLACSRRRRQKAALPRRGRVCAGRGRVCARASKPNCAPVAPPRQLTRPPALPDTPAAASSVAMSDPVDIKGDVRAAASVTASRITARLPARGRAAGSLTAAPRSWRRPASRRAARRCRCTRRAAGEWGGEAWLGETLRRLLRAVRRCSAGLPRGERSGAAAVERSRCQWFSFRCQACTERIKKDKTGEAHCTGQYFDFYGSEPGRRRRARGASARRLRFHQRLLACSNARSLLSQLHRQVRGAQAICPAQVKVAVLVASQRAARARRAASQCFVHCAECAHLIALPDAYMQIMYERSRVASLLAAWPLATRSIDIVWASSRRHLEGPDRVRLLLSRARRGGGTAMTEDGPSPHRSFYVASPQRFVSLALFAAICFSYAGAWLTLAPVTDVAMQRFDVGPGAVNVRALWRPLLVSRLSPRSAGLWHLVYGNVLSGNTSAALARGLQRSAQLPGALLARSLALAARSLGVFLTLTPVLCSTDSRRVCCFIRWRCCFLCRRMALTRSAWLRSTRRLSHNLCR